MNSLSRFLLLLLLCLAGFAFANWLVNRSGQAETISDGVKIAAYITGLLLSGVLGIVLLGKRR